MSRTKRRKGERAPREDADIKRTWGRGPKHWLDKDLQRMPPPSARSDGLSVRPAHGDERGGHTRAKADRLTERAQIEERINEEEGT